MLLRNGSGKKLRLFASFCLITCLLAGCANNQKYAPSPTAPPLQPICIPEKIKVALVLGSGGVRGMVHVGVLEELEKAGIQIDLIVGCSIGSLVGALYADNPDIEHVKCAVSQMKTSQIINLDLFECRYGLSQGKQFRQILDDHLEADYFEELKIPLVVVASDLWSGELVPIGCGELVRAVQASCSIPFIFVPIKLHGRILADGACIDPVPVMVARDLGADIIIAVDLCELLDATFPTNLFGIFLRAVEIAFMWQNEICTCNADVIIRPKMSDFGTFCEDRKDELYQAGKIAAREALPRIKELIDRLPEKDYKPRKYREVNLQPYSSNDPVRLRHCLRTPNEEPGLRLSQVEFTGDEERDHRQDLADSEMDFLSPYYYE